MPVTTRQPTPGVFWTADLTLVDAPPSTTRQVVPCHSVGDKQSLLRALATELHFPDDVGHGWDALQDALSDSVFSHGGMLLLLDGLSGLADADPLALSVLVDVLRECAGELFSEGMTFTAVLQLSAPPRFSIPPYLHLV